MALKGKLRIYTLSGGTRVLRMWKGLELSESLTGAVSRLLLVDTRGEIPDDVLCGWLNEVESERRTWEKNEKRR